jgi:hypothetical protein
MNEREAKTILRVVGRGSRSRGFRSRVTPLFICSFTFHGQDKNKCPFLQQSIGGSGYLMMTSVSIYECPSVPFANGEVLTSHLQSPLTYPSQAYFVTPSTPDIQSPSSRKTIPTRANSRTPGSPRLSYVVSATTSSSAI